ncbi:MAG: exosome complex protein Rrp42 [Thermoproteota archaeon]|nr:exosome complex protein Rrp42 [Candidatus Brockarchaeota archaeon]
MSITEQRPIISKLEKQELYRLLAEGKRVDGRGLLQYRNLNVQLNYIEKAEGSALVELGNTKILAAVKVGVALPFADTPNEGILIVNAELVPLASPVFEPGPPSEESISLARYVDRSIRESKAVDLSSLCIIPGRSVYSLYVDLYILDYDGNLIDASVIASVNALGTTKLPKYSVEGQSIKKLDEYFKLELKDLPVSITYAFFGDKYVVDPCLNEEYASDFTISMTVKSDDRFCAIQKNGGGMISPRGFLELLDKSIALGKELRSIAYSKLSGNG